MRPLARPPVLMQRAGSGHETSSYAASSRAPVLMHSCNSCHYNSQPPSELNDMGGMGRLPTLVARKKDWKRKGFCSKHDRGALWQAIWAVHFTVVVKQPPDLYMYTTPSSSLHPSLHPPLAGTTQEKEICHHTPSASTHSLQIQLTSMNESSGCYSYTKNGQVNHNYPYITVLFFS